MSELLHAAQEIIEAESGGESDGGGGSEGEAEWSGEEGEREGESEGEGEGEGEGEADSEEDASASGAGECDGAAAGHKATFARKWMLMLFPLAWMSRIGSERTMTNFTFLLTLLTWFLTKGKVTNYLRYARGMRQLSDHTRIKPCAPHAHA